MHHLATPNRRAKALRTVFRDFNLIVAKPKPNHVHGNSAANRSTATLSMEFIGSVLGLQTYFVQTGPCD